MVFWGKRENGKAGSGKRAVRGFNAVGECRISAWGDRSRCRAATAFPHKGEKGREGL